MSTEQVSLNGDRIDRVRPDVDPETTVHVCGDGEGGIKRGRYHDDLHGVCACVEFAGQAVEKTLAEAAKLGLTPCRQCEPADWRPEDRHDAGDAA